MHICFILLNCLATTKWITRYFQSVPSCWLCILAMESCIWNFLDSILLTKCYHVSFTYPRCRVCCLPMWNYFDKSMWIMSLSLKQMVWARIPSSIYTTSTKLCAKWQSTFFNTTRKKMLFDCCGVIGQLNALQLTLIVSKECTTLLFIMILALAGLRPFSPPSSSDGFNYSIKCKIQEK